MLCHALVPKWSIITTILETNHLVQIVLCFISIMVFCNGVSKAHLPHMSENLGSMVPQCPFGV